MLYAELPAGVIVPACVTGARSGALRAPELAESPVLLIFIQLEASWELLDVSWSLWGPLGSSWMPLETSLDLLRPSWRALEPS